MSVFISNVNLQKEVQLIHSLRLYMSMLEIVQHVTGVHESEIMEYK